MLPVIAGALGGVWLVAKGLSLDSERRLRRDYPSIPTEWWRPRDRFLAAKVRGWRLLKREEKVHELYRAYAAAHPDHSLGTLYLAVATGEEGRWQQSLEHAQHLVKMEPDLSVGFLRLAAAATKLGDAAAGELALARFLELEPDSAVGPHIETALNQLRQLRSRGGSAKPATPKKRAARKPASKATRRKPKVARPASD